MVCRDRARKPVSPLKCNVQDTELADAMAELSTEPGIKDRESVKDVLDGLRAYTERHYNRLEKTSEERFVLLWALQQMDGVGGERVGHSSSDEVCMVEFLCDVVVPIEYAWIAGHGFEWFVQVGAIRWSGLGKIGRANSIGGPCH